MFPMSFMLMGCVFDKISSWRNENSLCCACLISSVTNICALRLKKNHISKDQWMIHRCSHLILEQQNSHRKHVYRDQIGIKHISEIQIVKDFQHCES